MPPFDDPINGISTVKVGDKIRTSYLYEGVVTEVNSSGGAVFGDGFYFSPVEENCTLEILERVKPVKPVWQDGDVAINTTHLNELRYRQGGKWFNADHDQEASEDATAVFCQYKLVLRDGKPVTQ